jgi:hypothetical protein
VQLEDKIVEDVEEAHAESQQRADRDAHGEELLPAPAIEALVDASTTLHGELLGAIRMLLDHQALDVEALKLPEREREALAALEIAVEGRSSTGTFVYAEDRRDLLEQALAVLQPDLARGNDPAARELQAQLEDLTDRVGDLRHALANLEESQDDELIERQRASAAGKQDDEPGDKPKPPGEPDAPRPATTLTGPDRPEPARPPSTVTGPDRPEPPRPPSTVTGPERPVPPRPPSTLTGPDRPEPSPPPSTLTGPERPEPPRPPSTLTGEPAAATSEPATGDEGSARRPWWRRPSG